jgi:hypothetical protein
MDSHIEPLVAQFYARRAVQRIRGQYFAEIPEAPITDGITRSSFIVRDYFDRECRDKTDAKIGVFFSSSSSHCPLFFHPVVYPGLLFCDFTLP